MSDHRTTDLVRSTAMATSTVPADRRRRVGVKRLLKHAVLIGVGFVMIYPLLWMFTSSFRPTREIFAANGFGSTGFTLENYRAGWDALGYSFGRFLLNSAVIAILCIVGTLMSCSLAAYAFSRLQFRGRKVFFAIMLGTIMLPFHVVVVPQYILFNSLHLVDTIVPLVLPKFLGVEAFFVFLMVQFMRGIPRELDEAAAIDGAGPFRTFFSVILPLCLPALGVTAIFTFIWTWNDFFTPLLYLTSPQHYTVSVGLNAFQDSTGATNYGALFAMSIVTLIPVFIVFLAAQRTLTRGIATTGIK
jgi:multiple sugar transport system permease protein